MPYHVNILHLESDTRLAKTVSTRLPSNKYTTVISMNENDFFEKTANNSFDILILNCRSLSPNILGSIKTLSEQNKNYSIILTLESEDSHIIAEAMQYTCKAFVFKDVGDYSLLLLLSIQNIFDKIQLLHAKDISEKQLKIASKVAERVQKIALIGNWEYIPGKKLSTCSPQEFRNLGYQPGSVVPTYENFINTIHPDDRELVERHNNTCFTTHKKTEFIFRLLLKNNEIRYIRSIIEADVDHNNNLVRVFGVSQDITDQKRSEARLKQAATVFDVTSEAILISDNNNNIISTNPAFTRITGFSEQQVIGNNPAIFSSGRHDSGFFRDLWAQLTKHGFWQGEIWNKRSNGEIFPSWQSITVINDEKGKALQYVSVFIDITKRKKNEELITYQANFDALTDLPNRHLFLDRLENAVNLAKRNETIIALMLLDLDRFKWINDTLGHDAGDFILTETAKRLKNSVRKSDTVARLGGDEFTILLVGLKKRTDAEVIASKIFNAFSTPVDYEGNEIFISGSIGISIYPEDGITPDILQKKADSAMYSAKEAGRNRSHYFTPLLQAEAKRRLRLIGYMRRALEREEFSIYYQPVTDIISGTIVSAEALIRWQQPKLGFISPVEFIPLAEETGLIRPIGQWVLHRVAKDMQRWQKMGLNPIQISINKSPKQFSINECEKDWKTILDQYDIPFSRIAIEITETVLMEKGSHYSQSLAKMREMGGEISLDDFGTGYSSLSYLKRFPVDILKIDREFINGLMSDSSDALLVETIITLAEKMKLKVIAEGVETAEQLNFLKEHHCRYVQGYYFSKPLPCEEFEKYVVEH